MTLWQLILILCLYAFAPWRIEDFRHDGGVKDWGD